jgi:hypothetical protein
MRLDYARYLGTGDEVGYIVTLLSDDGRSYCKTHLKDSDDREAFLIWLKKATKELSDD